MVEIAGDDSHDILETITDTVRPLEGSGRRERTSVSTEPAGVSVARPRRAGRRRPFVRDFKYEPAARQAMIDDAIRVLAGDCTIIAEDDDRQEYRGRVTTIVKPDNTILVHDTDGYQPVAWLTRCRQRLERSHRRLHPRREEGDPDAADRHPRSGRVRPLPVLGGRHTNRDVPRLRRCARALERGPLRQLWRPLRRASGRDDPRRALRL